MRRIAVIGAAFFCAVALLTAGRLVGRLIRAPEITYSWPYGTLYAYDLRFNRSVLLIRDFNHYPVAWSWSPDGTRLAYVRLDEQGVYRLYVWSLRTRSTTRIADGLPFGSPPQWSPDGRMITAVNAKQDICLYPVDGGVTRCLNIQPAGQPVWSPGGDAIAYVARLPDGGLSRVDLATGQVTPLVTGAENLMHPRWSPDGTQIVFSYAPPPEGLRHLYLVPANGGTIQALTGGRTEQDQPVWFPDGSSIVYVDNSMQSRFQPDLSMINIETGEVTPVTSHPMHDASPRWSPDGAWLAFVTDRYNGAPRLIVVPADDLTAVEPLTEPGIPIGLYAYDWRP